MSIPLTTLRPRLSALARVLSTPRLLHGLTTTISTTTAALGSHRNDLLTLAIETSCDDTCVAILQKSVATGVATVHFHEKITSDNRSFGGVHPLYSAESHAKCLGPMIQRAVRALPELHRHLHEDGSSPDYGEEGRTIRIGETTRRAPDFVAVTRGPGMRSSLATGLNTAKGLALAWDVPLLGVNHMQAHALTPRLVSAMKLATTTTATNTTGSNAEAHDRGRLGKAIEPRFPYLSLLVSGGHTLLVHSRSICDHQILAEADNIAIGDVLDKCGRMLIPADQIAASENVMYGPLLENFAFASADDNGNGRGNEQIDYAYDPPVRRRDEIQKFQSVTGWILTPPLSLTSALRFDFSACSSQVQRALEAFPDMTLKERRELARHAMRLAFEHLAGRLVLALQKKSESMEGIKTVVVAGGVASNKYLMHILRAVLRVRGYGDIEVVAPPLHLCTDNAVMIAWAGMEMFEEGWVSSLGVQALRKWAIDPRAEDGGILGVDGG